MTERFGPFSKCPTITLSRWPVRRPVVVSRAVPVGPPDATAHPLSYGGR
jgi:hypothetical protein